MGTFLDFDFLAILNVFIILLWLAGSPYSADRRNALGFIVLILAAIAIVADVFFLVFKFGH